MIKVYRFFCALFFAPSIGWGAWSSSPTRLDLLAGGYNLQAKSDTSKGSISHMVWKGTARHAIAPSYEIALSYTLFTGDFSFKDIGYGPEVGFNYYPFTNTAPLKVKLDSIRLDLSDGLRPFVSGAFHQRQFQSLNSSYAGFSLGGGTDIPYSETFDIRLEGRYMLLQGPSSNTASQLDLMVGLSIGI